MAQRRTLRVRRWRGDLRVRFSPPFPSSAGGADKLDKVEDVLRKTVRISDVNACFLRLPLPLAPPAGGEGEQVEVESPSPFTGRDLGRG